MGGEEAADHHAGAGEKDDRERELKDHESACEASALVRTGGRRAVLEGGVEIDAGGAEGGDEAEEEAAGDRDGGEVGEDGVVDFEKDPVGLADIACGEVEGVDADGGEAETEEAAEAAKENAFDEELTDKLEAGGADGGTDGDVAGAGDGAGEHHVGDVGAGDEQHEEDGAEHHQENRANLVAVVGLVKRANERGEILVGDGEFGGEAAGDDGEVGAGLLEGDARAEKAEELERAVVAFFEFRGGREGEPKVFVGREAETGGHDADDGGGGAVEADGAADDVGGAGVAGLPDGVAEEDDDGRAGTGIVGGEIASKDRRGFEQVEEAGRDLHRAIALGWDGGLVDDGFHLARGFKAFERAVLVAVDGEVGVGHAAGVAGLSGNLGGYGDDAIAAGDWDRFEKDGVNEGEDGGVDADAEGEGDDDGEGIPRVRGEHAEGEAKIGWHGAEARSWRAGVMNLQENTTAWREVAELMDRRAREIIVEGCGSGVACRRKCGRVEAHTRFPCPKRLRL